MSSTILFTNACALNNMAVAMMLRSQFQSASYTLRSALRIMQNLLAAKSFAALEELQGFAEAKVWEASSTLSRISQNSYYKDSLSNFRVQAVESNDIHSLKLATSALQSFQPSLTVVFTRDPSRGYAAIDLFDMRQKSVIMLYNHGIASYMASSIKGNDIQQCRESNGYRSLAASQIGLSNLILESDDAMNDIENLMLLMLVMTCIGWVFLDCNDFSRASEVQQAVNVLQSAIEEDRVVNAMKIDDAFTAAAA